LTKQDNNPNQATPASPIGPVAWRGSDAPANPLVRHEVTPTHVLSLIQLDMRDPGLCERILDMAQISPSYQQTYDKTLKEGENTLKYECIAVAAVTNKNMRVGYIWGKVVNARDRDSLRFEIYMINSGRRRGSGLGTQLYEALEHELKVRARGCSKSKCIIYIPMKECIVHSTAFWKKNGFGESQPGPGSALTKTVYL